MTQIRKTYQEVNPELLYSEVKDFVLKQGVNLDETRLETYTLPDESASFISRGTLIFKVRDEAGGKECMRAHIVGLVRGETKMMLDIDEALFPKSSIQSLQDDLDFIFANYEVKS